MAIFNSYVKLPEGRYSQAKSHRLVVSPGWLNFIVASGDCYSWIYVYPKKQEFFICNVLQSNSKPSPILQ